MKRKARILSVLLILTLLTSAFVGLASAQQNGSE
jgi:uncharacterized membrane protein YkvI